MILPNNKKIDKLVLTFGKNCVMVRLLALLIVCSFAFTGCQVKSSNVVITTVSITDNEVFIIGDQKCTVGLMKMMLINQMNLQRESYGIDLLENDDLRVQKKYEQYIKNLSLDELSTVYSMSLLYDSMLQKHETSLNLSSEDTDEIEWAAEDFYKNLSPEEIEITGITEADLKDFYTRYTKARKIKSYLTDDVNTEVSDDEARVMHVEQIFVSDAKNAREVLSEINAGVSFTTIAANYNEADSISVTLQRGYYPEAVEEAAYDLDEGEISKGIEVDGGWYFIYCKEKYDEALSELHKDEIAETRRTDAFNSVYEPFVAALSSELNERVWLGLSLEGMQGIGNDKLYSTYEKYFS